MAVAITAVCTLFQKKTDFGISALGKIELWFWCLLSREGVGFGARGWFWVAKGVGGRQINGLRLSFF